MKKLSFFLLVGVTITLFTGCASSNKQVQKDYIPAPIVDGKKNGVAKIYDRYGRITRETPYLNDKKHGVQKVWYYNSQHQVNHSQYKNGKLDGPSKIFYKNKLISEMYFQNGLLHGKRIKYSIIDGRVIAERNYIHGKESGISRSWYKDGQLRESIPYDINGKRHGIAKYYYPNGELDHMSKYVHGKMTSTKLSKSSIKRELAREKVLQEREKRGAALRAEREAAMRANGGLIPLQCGGSNGSSAKSNYYGMNSYAGYGSADAQAYLSSNRRPSSKTEAINICRKNANRITIPCSDANAYVSVCVRTLGY